MFRIRYCARYNYYVVQEGCTLFGFTLWSDYSSGGDEYNDGKTRHSTEADARKEMEQLQREKERIASGDRIIY